MRRRHALLALAFTGACGVALSIPVLRRIRLRRSGGRTVREAVQLYRDQVHLRLMPRFKQAGVTYPPEQLVLLGLKEERLLEVWAKQDAGFVCIHRYPILKASGRPGPKLREGDRQVPEGHYRICGMNPNSSYHLSMKLARAEGRDQPGSDIFIHGKAVSIGCLAMGDPTIEELFVLVHEVGFRNVEVLLVPYDPRVRPLEVPEHAPAWLPGLYRDLTQAFEPYHSGRDTQVDF
jgi:murein L,D-transpeptidase YafK